MSNLQLCVDLFSFFFLRIVSLVVFNRIEYSTSGTNHELSNNQTGNNDRRAIKSGYKRENCTITGTCACGTMTFS